MDVLIYTQRKDIRDLVEEIQVLIPNAEEIVVSIHECKIKYGDNAIKIRRLNEACRGVKSKIILYDGLFTYDEKVFMKYQLINPFNYDEVLLAPYSILKWLVRNDVTYIDTVGIFEDEDIKLVTKNLVKAITFFKNNNGRIYCYQDNKEEGWLWDKRCEELFELRDEMDSYKYLIEFISEQ